MNVTPEKALRSISYISNNTQVVNVDRKGTVIAKNTGTARITVTVTNKDNKKTSVRVGIKVTENKQDSQPDPTPTPTPTPEPDPTPTPESGRSNILIAYFSATNTTEGVAENLADGLGADLYEIVPEEPYTDADLDYNDNSSRTTIEMNDPDVRPVISGSVENMKQYDIIFLGYPIFFGIL